MRNADEGARYVDRPRETAPDLSSHGPVALMRISHGRSVCWSLNSHPSGRVFQSLRSAELAMMNRRSAPRRGPVDLAQQPVDRVEERLRDLGREDVADRVLWAIRGPRPQGRRSKRP